MLNYDISIFAFNRGAAVIGRPEPLHGHLEYENELELHLKMQPVPRSKQTPRELQNLPLRAVQGNDSCLF